VALPWTGLRPHARPNWRLETLAGWHLPLLGDPAFLPIQPVLHRAALMGMPNQLLRWIGRDRPLAPQVFVAFAEHSQTALGLVVSSPLNRSGSCWQVQHLRTTRADLRSELSADLLRAAMERANACSWVAVSATADCQRLAVLREQGFQPLRQDQLWCWQPPCDQPPAANLAGGELQLRPLQRRNAVQLWHLEQTVCPAQLRQILDRRVEDLLEQSQGRGWMLIDPNRDVAVAAIRWQGEHAGGGHDLELCLHPGWEHLYGPASTLLLMQMAQSLGAPSTLWLRSDPFDSTRLAWLASLGAEHRSDRVLMARSLWRRQALPDGQSLANRRLEAVLAQLQGRQRPVPTPVERR